MKTYPLILLIVLILQSCQSKKETLAENSEKSQYVIESNTMIFYDRSITDAIKAREFFKCIDVFSSNVTAKINHSPTDIKNFRVLSIIYDEKQMLDIDLRSNSSFVNLRFYLLGYIILDNGTGNSILEVIQPYSGQSIDIYVKGIKTDISTLTNMAHDIRPVINDQIVYKKDNVGVIPFKRINVFHSNILVKNFQNNTIYKVIDIYRPSELSRSIVNPPVGSQASWFVTAMPLSANKETANGSLVYIKNPQIVEN